MASSTVPSNKPSGSGAKFFFFVVVLALFVISFPYLSGKLGTMKLPLLSNITNGFSSQNISNIKNNPKVLTLPQSTTNSDSSADGTDNIVLNSAGYIKALDQASDSLIVQIQKSPQDSSLYNRLGLVYLRLGDLNAAQQCFTKAADFSSHKILACSSKIEKAKAAGNLSDESNEILETSKLTIELCAAHANLARVYDLKGDRSHALAELALLSPDQIVAPSPKQAELGVPPVQLTKAYTNLTPAERKLLAQGEYYFYLNQFPAAVVEYNKLLAMNPNVARAHDRLAMISVLAGDIASGAKEWEIAARLDPKSSIIENNLGLAYEDLGRHSQAEGSFRLALVLDPHSEEAALNLSQNLSARGRWSEAVAVLQSAADKNPTSARAQNNLAAFLSLTGHYFAAISAYYKALALDAEMASAHYGLGVAFMKIKNYLPAIQELKQAVALDAKLHEAEVKMEECYRIMGRNTSSQTN